MSARVLHALRSLLFLSLVLFAIPLFAQQTGSISGKVTASDGSALPGVTVEARSDVLPGPRVTVTGANGEYRLRALPPGSYTLKFDLSGMKGATRKAEVQLDKDTGADVTLGMQAVSESATVTAEVSLVDKESAAITSGVSTKQLQALPIAQDYRDIQKYIPAVQYTEDTVRGPSAGGSGQDNVYLFDGANVSLPQYGNLSAEPASHDVAQVTVVNGGARAVDFNRSGGFWIDSVSKSGTSAYHGEASYQLQTKGMVSGLNTGIQSRYDQDSSWLNVSLGGPILQDNLYFYGSYYRPEHTRENRANLYGALPEFDSTRNEGFGKVTITPLQSLLVNLSYRESKKTETSSLFGAADAPTTGTGGLGKLRIATGDASWIINSRSFATVKYSYFANPSQGRPDNISSAVPSFTPGTQLDLANLDKLGLLTVPLGTIGDAAYKAFVQSFIDKYGYTSERSEGRGRQRGFRIHVRRGQLLPGLHPGRLQHHARPERHARDPRGLSVVLGSGDPDPQLQRLGIAEHPRRPACAGPTGQSAYFTATFQQQTTGQAAPIQSEYAVAEHRGERHDPVEELDVQPRRCSRATTSSSARGCRTTTRRCPDTSRRRETSTRCTRSPSRRCSSRASA